MTVPTSERNLGNNRLIIATRVGDFTFWQSRSETGVWITCANNKKTNSL